MGPDESRRGRAWGSVDQAVAIVWVIVACVDRLDLESRGLPAKSCSRVQHPSPQFSAAKEDGTQAESTGILMRSDLIRHDAIHKAKHDVVESPGPAIRHRDPLQTPGGQLVVDGTSAKIVLGHVAALRASFSLSWGDRRGVLVCFGFVVHLGLVSQTASAKAQERRSGAKKPGNDIRLDGTDVG